MLFDVTPKEFQLGDNVTLTAEIKYAGTNDTFTGYNVQVEFIDVHNDSLTTNSTTIESNLDGTATLNHVVYLIAGSPHAFKARIINQILGDKQPQDIVSNPVQLTVSKTTKLFLNVTRPDPPSTNHHFFGNVTYTYDGSAVPAGLALNVTINQTLCYQGSTQQGEPSASTLI